MWSWENRLKSAAWDMGQFAGSQFVKWYRKWWYMFFHQWDSLWILYGWMTILDAWWNRLGRVLSKKHQRKKQKKRWWCCSHRNRACYLKLGIHQTDRNSRVEESHQRLLDQQKVLPILKLKTFWFPRLDVSVQHSPPTKNNEWYPPWNKYSTWNGWLEREEFPFGKAYLQGLS